jgi:hypothetical protein
MLQNQTSVVNYSHHHHVQWLNLSVRFAIKPQAANSMQHQKLLPNYIPLAAVRTSWKRIITPTCL